MKTLYVLIGLPGRGKSTWCRNRPHTHTGCATEWDIISRDNIRFSMLKPEEDYFAHEKEVWNEYVQKVADSINDPWTINTIADSTNLSPKARRRLINEVRMALKPGYKFQVVYIYFDVYYITCIRRNNQRHGRERVPEEAILNMKKALIFPTAEESELLTRIEIVRD